MICPSASTEPRSKWLLVLLQTTDYQIYVNITWDVPTYQLQSYQCESVPKTQPNPSPLYQVLKAHFCIRQTQRSVITCKMYVPQSINSLFCQQRDKYNVQFLKIYDLPFLIVCHSLVGTKTSLFSSFSLHRIKNISKNIINTLVFLNIIV